jgi:hypothetical protein
MQMICSRGWGVEANLEVVEEEDEVVEEEDEEVEEDEKRLSWKRK